MFVQLLNQNATNILEKTRQFMAFQVSVTHWFLLTPFCHQATVVTPEEGGEVRAESLKQKENQGKGAMKESPLGTAICTPACHWINRLFICLFLYLEGGMESRETGHFHSLGHSSKHPQSLQCQSWEPGASPLQVSHLASGKPTT